MRSKGLLVLAAITAGAALCQAQDDEYIPDLGTRRKDGFLVRCYWVGEFELTKRARDQGVVGVFGQALTPLSYDKHSTATFIFTEEVDNDGKMRLKVGVARWKSEVSNCFYWSKAGKHVRAGPGGAGGGDIAPKDINVKASEGAGTISINFGIDTTGDDYRFDVRYAPLEIKGLKVQVSGQEKTERWTSDIGGIVASDEPVKPNKKTVIRAELGDPKTNFYGKWVVTRVCDTSDLHLVTPHGDPRTAPVDSGRGQNEYTFSSATPGVLTINFEATAKPGNTEILQHIKDRVSFSVDGISGSKMQWDAANPNGRSSVRGNQLVAKATFTNLPAKIDDFGKKKVQLLVDGNPFEKTNIEVFFPRDATNHPGGQTGSPNWFYYYLQTVAKLGPKPNIKYPATGTPQAGHTSHFDPGPDEICIDDGSISGYTPPYGAYGRLYGIDNFAWCVTHEMQHYKDWADFWDVDNKRMAKWFNAVGKNGPDDDRDRDQIPNRVEDVNLNGRYDRGDLYDWKKYRTGASGTPGNITNDFEDWDCKRHTGQKGNHARDWADPGMQHLTLDKWDD